MMVTILSQGLEASTTTLRWGIDDQLHHQIRITREFKADIEAYTQKRVRVKIEPYDIKDETHSAVGFIGNNTYDIAQSFVGNYSQMSKKTLVWEIPFLFTSNEHVEAY